jgi:FMN phosphatase YigB (HAD superfamily)
MGLQQPGLDNSFHEVPVTANTDQRWNAAAWNDAYAGMQGQSADLKKTEGSLNAAPAGSDRDWHILKVGGAVLAVASTAAIVLAASKHHELARLFRGAGTVIESAKPAGKLIQSGREALNLEKIDTLLFDFDRTLVDTDRATNAYNTTLLNALADATKIGRDVLEDGIKALQHDKQTIFIGKRLDLIQPLKETYGDNVNQVLSGVSQAAHKAYHEAIQPPSDVLEMLDAARSTGKRMAMVTAGSPTHTIEKLEAAGLSKYFDHIFVYRRHIFEDSPESNLHIESPSWSKIVEMPGQGKHTSDGYQFVVNHLNLVPDHAMMTGDHTREDVSFAQERGLYGALATYIRNVPDPNVLPDLIVDHPGTLTHTLISKTISP